MNKCVYCGNTIKVWGNRKMTCSKPCSNAYNWLPLKERHRRKKLYGWEK